MEMEGTPRTKRMVSASWRVSVSHRLGSELTARKRPAQAAGLELRCHGAPSKDPVVQFAQGC